MRKGIVEAVNERRRLAAIELGESHAVVQWLGQVVPAEGDVVQGYLDSFGDEYLEDLTSHSLIKANVRFLRCNRAVAMALVHS